MDLSPATVPPLDDRSLSGWQVARRFFPHLLALLFPLNALLFSLSGPHGAATGLLFIIPIAVALRLDRRSPPELRQPNRHMPAWPFNMLLAVLVVLQVANVVLLARLFSQQSLWSLDTLIGIVVVGSSSGYSGIVVAHELIHRPQSWVRQFGRLLLATVLYEHFYTEHVRGHHVRVGTAEDPATARFGESFGAFYVRTVPAQFRSAYRLEKQRVGRDLPFYHPRTLKNRVIQGVIFEWTAAIALWLWLGPAAFIMHLLQAAWATRALEVVNYFEHWGIERTTRRVLPQHSWDTDSRFTYFALTGLSRHADHHAFASRPYQQLRSWPSSPRLPRGYLAMFPLVLVRNARYRQLMSAELERCGMRRGQDRAPAELAPTSARQPSTMQITPSGSGISK